jgi:hypothetical protein
MAASTNELKRIYQGLFVSASGPQMLVRLRDALLDFDQERVENTRGLADKILAELNDGKDPELTVMQLSCLKRLFDGRELDSVTPLKLGAVTVAPAFAFYGNATADAGYPELFQSLQQLVYEYSVDRSDQKRDAALQKLRAIAPATDWGNAELSGFEYLMVRDARFKSIAPFPVDLNLW